MDLSSLRDKRNLINLIILIIIIIAIPASVYLVRQQQILKSRAEITQIIFIGDRVVTLPDGKKGLKLNQQDEAKVDLHLISPLGPP